MDYKSSIEAYDKLLILIALKHNKYKINQTARTSNIPRKTLFRKLVKYNLNVKELVKNEVPTSLE